MAWHPVYERPDNDTQTLTWHTVIGSQLQESRTWWSREKNKINSCSKVRFSLICYKHNEQINDSHTKRDNNSISSNKIYFCVMNAILNVYCSCSTILAGLAGSKILLVAVRRMHDIYEQRNKSNNWRGDGSCRVKGYEISLLLENFYQGIIPYFISQFPFSKPSEGNGGRGLLFPV